MFKDGINFVNNLVDKFGLLEGYRIAERYLEIKEDGSTEEAQFRQGMRFAMLKVDQI